jgi:hypothetical protein
MSLKNKIAALRLTPLFAHVTNCRLPYWPLIVIVLFIICMLSAVLQFNPEFTYNGIALFVTFVSGVLCLLTLVYGFEKW